MMYHVLLSYNMSYYVLLNLFPVQFFSFTSCHVPRRLLAVHPQSHVEPCFV